MLYLLSGLAAGWVCFVATLFVERTLRIDDSLDVFPVHGVGGMLGTILAGVFAATTLGPFSGYGLSDAVSGIGGQLGVQFIGLIAVLVYTAVVTWLLLKIIGAVVGLRIGPEEEDIGLDISEHEERGYDL